MNGGDKIIDRIKADSKSAVDAVMAQSARECKAIMSEAEQTAGKRAAAIDAKTQTQLNQIAASSKSRAELETRNALLKQRRAEIDKTVTGLQEYLLSLPDDRYFDAVYKLAAQLSGKSGVVYLNQKDLDRKPADFEEKLRANGLNATVGDKPLDISGGFVLKDGNIEENMDFKALISSRKDELEDLIHRELFDR